MPTSSERESWSCRFWKCAEWRKLGYEHAPPHNESWIYMVIIIVILSAGSVFGIAEMIVHA